MSPDLSLDQVQIRKDDRQVLRSRIPFRALVFGQLQEPVRAARHRGRSCASPPPHIVAPILRVSTSDPGPISPRVKRWRHREAETFPAQWAMGRPDHDSDQNVHGRETRQQTSERRSSPPQAWMYVASQRARRLMLPSLEPAGRSCEPLPWFRPPVTASEEQYCAGQLRYCVQRVPQYVLFFAHTTGEDPRSR